MSFGHEESVIDRISEGNISSSKVNKWEEIQQEKFQVITENSRNYLNDIIKQNLTKPIRIQSLQVIGGNQFRQAFLSRQLQPLLTNDKLTLENFLERIDEVKDNFLNSQSISNMGLQVDQSYFKTKTPKNGIELITNVHIQPVKKYFLKIGTNVGNGEGDGYLTLLYRNIFGGAEMLTLDSTIASSSLNLRNKSTYLLNFSLPFFNNPNWKLENIVFQSNRNVDFMCNHEQIIKGFNNRITSQYKFLNHEFSIENVLRTINTLGNSAYMLNDDILLQSGDNFKSSVNYSISFDNRDDKILPSSGYFVKNSIELSLLDPFIKNQIEFQMASSISSTNFFNFSFRTGYIQKLLNSKPIHLMDRFYMGGPNDLRGYALNGLGPKLMSSTVGGNFFYGASLSLFQNLGKYDNFKFQGFVNAGSLINVKSLDQAIGLLNEPSVCAGVGLIYKHPIARFELNFVLPIISHSYDSTRKGLQYGIGLSFM